METHKYSKPITSLTKEELKRYKFFAGHFSFGYDELFDNQVLYIGVVRDPIDRIVSDYYYIKERGRSDLKELANKLSLEEYIWEKFKNTKSQLVHSSQIVQLTGQNDLERAKEIINKQYLFICTTEQLDECQQFLAKKYNREDLVPVRSNKTKTKIVGELTQALLDKLSYTLETDFQFIDYIDLEFKKLIESV